MAHDEERLEAERRVDYHFILCRPQQRRQPARLARVCQKKDHVMRVHQCFQLLRIFLCLRPGESAHKCEHLVTTWAMNADEARQRLHSEQRDKGVSFTIAYKFSIPPLSPKREYRGAEGKLERCPGMCIEVQTDSSALS